MKPGYMTGRTIYDYINRNAVSRKELAEVVAIMQRNLPKTVVFGGMVRDFMLGGARVFNSDIDLVVDAKGNEIYDVIKGYNPEKNKFGGFRFLHGAWMFDVWPLSATWAFKEGLVEASGFEKLLDTTFFNVDSAFFQFDDRKLCVSECFKKGLKERILDINLETNPAPKKMVLRALRLAAIHNFSMSCRLVEYVLEQQSAHKILNENLYRKMSRHVAAGDMPFCFSSQLEFDFR